MLVRILGGTAITVGVCAAYVLPAMADDCTQISAQRPPSFGLPPDPGRGCDDGPEPGNGGPDPDPFPDPGPIGPCIADIKPLSTQGRAPFTLHAHGLNVDEDPAECLLDAVYLWDFGDPGGAYNQLEGWNAAHVYEQSGTYTVTLTITDPILGVLSDTETITVLADNRTPVYVAGNGNDGNDGSSPSQAVRTIDRVKQLVADNTKVLIKRGYTYRVYELWDIEGDSITVTTWGNGSRPLLLWEGLREVQPIIRTNPGASSIVIQDLEFASSYAPAKEIPRGIQPHGTNITVRRCHFRNLSDAMNSAPYGVQGWLTLENSSDPLGGYFAWNDGADIVHLGNTIAESLVEHDIRGHTIHRIIVGHNTMGPTSKSNVWLMEGSYAWIGSNSCEADVSVGPHNALHPGPERQFLYARIESNDLDASNFLLNAGSKHVRYYNNYCMNRPWNFQIIGSDDELERFCVDVHIENNTIVHHGETAVGMWVSQGFVDGLYVRNNLVCFPNFVVQGSPNRSNFNTDSDPIPDDYVFEGNLWSTPSNADADGPHYVSGIQSVEWWDDLPGTANEQYRLFQPGDIDENGNPTFPTEAGARR